MRYAKYILILLCCITLADCTGVVTKDPIGDVLNLKEEMQKNGGELEGIDLEGVWNGGDDIIYSKLLKDGKTLKIAGLRWDGKKQEFSLWSDDVVLSELDDNIYANQKKENGDGYYIASLGGSLVEGDGVIDILISYPDTTEFRRALREGKLLGEPEDPNQKDTDIYLRSPKEDIDAYIKDNRRVLFDFETPKVYRKIPWVKLN